MAGSLPSLIPELNVIFPLNTTLDSEAAVQRFYQKKVFWKIPENFQKKTCGEVNFQ